MTKKRKFLIKKTRKSKFRKICPSKYSCHRNVKLLNRVNLTCHISMVMSPNYYILLLFILLILFYFVLFYFIFLEICGIG